MLIDARTLPKDKIIETDVCIVGAGAAGITLAREFIGQPFRVGLLESGGLEFDQGAQSLYEGENIGLPYLQLGNAGRLRYFGGTTNHWGGWCRPLDENDFETREWIPHSGWPFRKSHLDPYYKRAQSILQLGPYAYEAEDWETDHAPRLPLTGDQVITKIYQVSPPTRFGTVYRSELVRADNVTTYLHANVVDIKTTYTGQTVTRVRAASLQGNKFWVSAKFFILATGGIENARLLLVSNEIHRTGLGNQKDLVGRFFMEHPHLESGSFLPSDPYLPLDLYLTHKVIKEKKVAIQGVLSLSPEILRREKLMSFSAKPIAYTREIKGVLSAKLLLKEVRRGQIPDDFMKHLRNVIADIDDVARAVYGRFSQQIILLNITEQAPNPDSRLTLSDERDSLGTNRVRLDWRLSPIDKRTIRRAHEIIGQQLGRAGLGRLRVTLDDDDTTWSPSLTGGGHHMGTTRMHIDPKRGVVNQNCQVHGISNLFIAGSSVFPTCGFANPTLTIVALAVRLADHVKRVMT